MLESNIGADGTEEKWHSPKDVKDTISRLHDIAALEMTAEGSAFSNMLATRLKRQLKSILTSFKISTTNMN